MYSILDCNQNFFIIEINSILDWMYSDKRFQHLDSSYNGYRCSEESLCT